MFTGLWVYVFFKGFFIVFIFFNGFRVQGFMGYGLMGFGV